MLQMLQELVFGAACFSENGNRWRIGGEQAMSRLSQPLLISHLGGHPPTHSIWSPGRTSQTPTRCAVEISWLLLLLATATAARGRIPSTGTRCYDEDRGAPLFPLTSLARPAPRIALSCASTLYPSEISSRTLNRICTSTSTQRSGTGTCCLPTIPGVSLVDVRCVHMRMQSRSVTDISLRDNRTLVFPSCWSLCLDSLTAFIMYVLSLKQVGWLRE